MTRITDEQTIKVIRIVELNNKSRKGRYVYIREKGMRGAYYKYTGEKLNVYDEYYQIRHKQQKKDISIKKYKEYYKEKKPTRKPTITKIKEYTKKPKTRKKTPREHLRKGTNQVKINKIKPTREQITEKLKELIKPMLKDETKTKLMIKNIDKIKGNLRYHVRINGYTNQGEYRTLAEIIQVGKYNPYTIIKLLTGTILKEDTHLTSNNYKKAIKKIGLNDKNQERLYHSDSTVKEVKWTIEIAKG